MKYVMRINGQTYNADVDPDMPLLWILRDVLGLTGTKFGCGMGQCGACTVLVAGKARPSCTFKAEAAAGQEITTIEGIPYTHPVKQAWIVEQVPQCGYCQPGQILRTVSLLSQKADPGDKEIADTMRTNLCRCGTYPRIKKAIKRAAGGIAAGTTSDMLPKRNAATVPEQLPGDSFELNPFVRIGTDGVVTVISKHYETGQGIYTGLATILAEELDADWSMVRVESAPANAALYNNLMFGSAQGTGASTSIANSYEQYRGAGAAARAMLVAAAASQWGVSPAEIGVEHGVVMHGRSGRRASFGELAQKAAGMAPPAHIRLKSPEAFTLIGKQGLRVDVEEKAQGQALYGMDMRLPGMVTCMVARPPRFGGKVKAFDAGEALAIPGVTRVIEIPEGVAVVATDTWAAKRGRDALRVEWDDTGAEMRGTKELREEYRALLETPGLTARAEGDVDEALARAGRTVEATFEFPYLAHAPLEPLNCVVQLSDGRCDIWAGHQLQTEDQMNAAKAAGLDASRVHLTTLFAGGSFGRRGNYPSDWVVEGVHIAKVLGGRAPVHLVWTREDDMRRGFYRPMYVHRVQASLDDSGKVLAWRHRVAGQSIFADTPAQDALVKNGIDSTSLEGLADMPYAIPHLAIELHTTKVGVPVLWWRSVGHSHTAFAVEVVLDELAHAAGRDPVELRRALLPAGSRHRGVLDLAAEKSGWGSTLPPGRSRGVAVHESFGTFVAQVAEISIAKDGTFQVERVVCAVDCGTVINPDIIRSQMEGGIAFGLSAAFEETITLHAGRVQQSGFDTYKLLRFNRMPEVEVHIVSSLLPPTGVGEPGLPPIAPAVANALFAATGKSIRHLPMLG